MNILMTSDLAGLGGGETSLINLVDEFKVNNYVCVICNEQGRLVEILERKKINTYVIEYRKKRQILHSFFQIRKILKDEKIQVIHSNDPLTSVIFFFSSFGLKIHNYWTCHGQWYRFSPIKLFLIKLSNRRIFCVSKKVQDSLKDMGFQNTVLTYLGIPLDEYIRVCPIDIRKKYSIDRESFLVGMVGRFQQIKGQLKLVKAIELLLRENPRLKIKCLLIGGCIYNTKEEKEYYSEVVNYIKEHHLEEVMLLLGERNDVPGILKCLDLLVVPSDNESFGMVAIEALACGTPIISTPNDGVSEILEYESEFISKSNDFEGIACLINDVIKNDKFKDDMNEFAYRRRIDFDIKVVANKYLNEFNGSTLSSKG